jgi:hypothetical protein
MNIIRYGVTFVILIAFLCGFIVFLNDNIYMTYIWEDFEGSSNAPPSMMVKDGNQYVLILGGNDASNNSITFDNLQDLDKYLEKRKAEGKPCPKQYIQKENNAQGDDVYKVYPTSSPSKLEGGLQPFQGLGLGLGPSVQLQPPFTLNDNSYPGFDPYGLFQGRISHVDKVHESTQKAGAWSENPMDPNWGGVEYTQHSVDNGNYKDREVTKISYPNMKNIIPL